MTEEQDYRGFTIRPSTDPDCRSWQFERVLSKGVIGGTAKSPDEAKKIIDDAYEDLVNPRAPTDSPGDGTVTANDALTYLDEVHWEGSELRTSDGVLIGAVDVVPVTAQRIHIYGERQAELYWTESEARQALLAEVEAAGYRVSR